MKRSEASYRFEIERLREELELAYSRLEVAEQAGKDSVAVESAKPARVCFMDVCRAARPTDPHFPPRPSGGFPTLWALDRHRLPPALKPTPGRARPTLSTGAQRVVGFSVCGLSDEALEAVVATIARLQDARRDFIPVFLTDCLTTRIFRERGFAFEFFPADKKGVRRLEGTAPWAEYALARRELLEAKYGLSEIVTFGPLPFGSQ
jgi:hypothetical protein